MEFRVLGPVEASCDGVEVVLGSAATRATLAVLLLNAPNTVPMDRLVDELWGEDVPESARKMVQIRISKLRQGLPDGTITTRSPGYALSGESLSLDLVRFGELFNTGRRALMDGDPRAARSSLGSALALWRGPAFAEFNEPFAQRERARLEELRLVCLEERIDSDMALGEGPELAAELETLVTENPFRERLCGQLMRALYRQDRQADALAAYQDARRRLVEQLGIEPGRSLQGIERAILQHDLALGEPRSATPGGPPIETSLERVAPERADSISPSSSPFVGREAEWTRIEGALDAALGGSGRLVILGGEPGIGKTRVARELAIRAEDRAARVLWGRCYEGGGAPPYWPWVQALRGYVAELGSDEARAELGQGAGVLADMIPELREQWPDLERPPPLPDAKQARFRLLETVGRWLARACDLSPMVIIVEDLHAADPDSLTMLAYVAGELRGLPLLLAVTHRDGGADRSPALTDALAELGRATTPEKITLGGLPQKAVADYMRLTLDKHVPAALADAVHDRTDGNPLFVTEVVRLLVGSEVATESIDDVRAIASSVPEGVRDAIGQRLSSLSALARDLLTFASVVGREFNFAQVETLRSDLTPEQVLDALDEALDTGLLEEASRPSGYRFAHALIRDALIDSLSTARRIRLEAQVAVGLEALYGAGVDEHAAELAQHFAEAETMLGSAKLITYSKIAAERSLGAHAFEEAILHAQRALDSILDEPMSSQHAELLFILARAELGALELYELGATLERLVAAFNYYSAAGEEPRAVEVATHPLPPIWVPTEAPAMLDRALAMVPLDSLAAGQLLASRAWFIGAHEGDYPGAEHAFGRALAIAERLEDGELERRTVVTHAQVDYWHMRWSECHDRGQRAIELATVAGDQRTELIAREWPARVAAITGHVDRALEHATVARKLGERLRERHELATAHMYASWLHGLTGDWDPTRELSNRALLLQPREPRNLATRAILELQTGNEVEGEDYLRRLLDPERRTNWGLVEQLIVAAFVPMARRITGGEHGLDTAIAAARAVLDTPTMPPLLHLYPNLGLAFVAINRGDRDLARDAYAALVGQQGTAVIMASVSTDRVLGLLAGMTGDLALAITHFNAALTFCARAGYRPELAWSAADYAEILLREGTAEDSALANDLRKRARILAEDAAMEPLCDRLAQAST
jgi:DNA-binding SARP family transcriptional activator/tetratricopeptide (TPR) repeat protein